jgi:hypothetical protein
MKASSVVTSLEHRAIPVLQGQCLESNPDPCMESASVIASFDTMKIASRIQSTHFSMKRQQPAIHQRMDDIMHSAQETINAIL